MLFEFSRQTKWRLALAPLFCCASFNGQMADEQQFDLETYWRKPLAEQGEPPTRWTSAERAFEAAACGACHPETFAQWQTSRHAHAFSPGLVAQLLGQDAAATAECLQCHAPLAEQREAFEAARARGLAHRPDAQGLAASGNSCGGCHLRHHQRFGPPQRGTGATGASPLPAPHGGAFRTSFFERAEFCSTCHQFTADTAVNGKPLENTFVEWQASPQAAQGIVCQTCHMPDRAHLWRGIHDPAMVAKGLTPRIAADSEKVLFELTNSGAGHAFPTYTVPTVVMSAVALEADGTPRPQTLRTHVIARRVHFDGTTWAEDSDTRLVPGESAAIELPWNGSARARVWLDVIPDDFYTTQVFPGLMQTLPARSEARRLALEASAAAESSRFRLYETELRRP
jgi:Cytochrome c554 and c-prime